MRLYRNGEFAISYGVPIDRSLPNLTVQTLKLRKVP